MTKWGARDIAYAGIIAALYAVLSIVFAPISFGVYQIRVAEALTVLPFLFPSAPYGLFAGCLVANIYGGNGIQDIIFGSLLTLLAGLLTRYAAKLKPRPIAVMIAPLPPVIINAFGVALYLAEIFKMPYFTVVLMIGVGQLAACYLIGLPLLILLLARQFSPTPADNV
ncbi:MAG: QueT transporter family protein [bacterium]|jgi:uncharacterized membrane protein